MGEGAGHGGWVAYPPRREKGGDADGVGSGGGRNPGGGGIRRGPEPGWGWDPEGAGTRVGVGLGGGRGRGGGLGGHAPPPVGESGGRGGLWPGQALGARSPGSSRDRLVPAARL